MKNVKKVMTVLLVALMLSGTFIGVAFAFGLMSWNQGSVNLQQVNTVLRYLDTELTAEKKLVETKESEIATLTTSLEEALAKAETNQGLIDKLNGELETAKHDLSVLEAMLADINVSDPDNNGLPGKIKALQAKIVELNGDKAILQTDLAAANLKAKNLQTEIDKLKAELTTAKTSITTLTSEKETLKASNTQLEADNNTLTNSKTALQNEVTRLESELQKALNDAETSRLLADDIMSRHSGTGTGE